MPSLRANRRRRGTRSSFQRRVGDTTETVAQSFFERFELVVSFYAVEFLIQGYALAFLRHVA